MQGMSFHPKVISSFELTPSSPIKHAARISATILVSVIGYGTLGRGLRMHRRRAKFRWPPCLSFLPRNHRVCCFRLNAGNLRKDSHTQQSSFLRRRRIPVLRLVHSQGTGEATWNLLFWRYVCWSLRWSLCSWHRSSLQEPSYGELEVLRTTRVITRRDFANAIIQMAIHYRRSRDRRGSFGLYHDHSRLALDDEVVV